MTYKGAIKQLYEMRDNNFMPEFFKPYFDKIIETLTGNTDWGTDDVWENANGEWIFPYGNKKYKRCSICGKTFYSIPATSNFCPNCGADMRSKS